jgi:hypothetical protein
MEEQTTTTTTETTTETEPIQAPVPAAPVQAPDTDSPREGEGGNGGEKYDGGEIPRVDAPDLPDPAEEHLVEVEPDHDRL